MTKRLVAKVGTYEKDGKEKGEYVRIGVILSNDNGEYALLDPTVNLAGILIKQRLLNPKKAGDSVICSVFTDESQSKLAQAASHGHGVTQQPDDFDDSDIPF